LLLIILNNIIDEPKKRFPKGDYNDQFYYYQSQPNNFYNYQNNLENPYAYVYNNNPLGVNGGDNEYNDAYPKIMKAKRRKNKKSNSNL
jgi:hypothetical protein